MKKHKPISGMGIVLAFIGLTGRRDDFFATVEKIDLLGLPAWLDWFLVAVGVVLLIYGVWPRGEAVNAMDREWSEEGAIKAYDLRLQHHRELFPHYIAGLLILTSFSAIIVLITTCEEPASSVTKSRELYLSCLNDNLDKPELCKRLIKSKEHE